MGLGKNVTAAAGSLLQVADQDLRVKFDKPRLEEFMFSNARPARNISDWVDLQKMKNISVENKTTKVTCSTWEEMKALRPELETKGLAARLTVCMAPYGVVAKLRAECDKLNKDVNVTALPTWGIKSSAAGGSAQMAYPLNYCPVEKPGIGWGLPTSLC